jgi:hypothetical protein
MIDVRVREHDGIERLHIERQRLILFRGVLSATLEHAEVERDG